MKRFTRLHFLYNLSLFTKDNGSLVMFLLSQIATCDQIEIIRFFVQ